MSFYGLDLQFFCVKFDKHITQLKITEILPRDTLRIDHEEEKSVTGGRTALIISKREKSAAKEISKPG